MPVPGFVDRPPGYRAPAAFFRPWHNGQAPSSSLTPGTLQYITVTGTFLNPQGVPASGTVTFTPSTTPLKDVASKLFTGGSVTVTLNGSGAFAVPLICTDDNDLSPSGWTYTITTVVNGLTSTYTGKVIPYSPLSATDLSDLLP